MITAHLIYGLSTARQQFTDLINDPGKGWDEWARLGYGRDDVPVFTDQLVPNVSEQSQDEVDRKRDIMMSITRNWGDDANRKACLEQIQVVLTKHLQTTAGQRAPTYLPTDQPYSEWETLRKQIGVTQKHNDFFARKCKSGLRMPKVADAQQGFGLGQTVFVVNGLDMVAVVSKAQATRSLITFRELRETYRSELRAPGQNPQLPLYVRVLHEPNGQPRSLTITPPPWSDDWVEQLTSSQFRVLGGKVPPRMGDDEASKFFAVRGSDLWNEYKPALTVSGGV